MAEPRGVDDADLIAFSDHRLGEDARADIKRALAADDRLRERLAVLDRGRGQAETAFASMLDDAPEARLNAMLGNVLAGTRRDPPAAERRFMRLDLIAATVAIFVIGAIAGGLIAGGFGRQGAQDGSVEAQGASETWRQAVAEYWSLTTAETLSIAPPPALAKSQLALAGTRLGLDLEADASKLQDIAFRGAELFDFRGRPLVQIAYLDPTYGPVAYCIIADPSNASLHKTTETLDGFTIVHWAGGGHARLLIGKAPAQALERYAERLDG